MGRDDNEVPQQSEAASQHSSPHDPNHEAAETAQAAQSLASNAPVQLIVEALAAQQEEAQENAQQSAASQVDSGSATHNHTPMLQEITEEQLRAQLADYYADGRVMGPVMGLACLQVIPLTAFLRAPMAVPGNNVTSLILTFLPNVFFVQPANCLIVVLWGLADQIESMVPVVNKGSSLDPRPRGRLGLLDGALPVLLFGADVGFLGLGGAVSFEAGFALSAYVFVVFVVFYGVGAGDILRRRTATQRLSGQGGTDTSPVVAEGQHELEAIRVVPVEG